MTDAPDVPRYITPSARRVPRLGRGQNTPMAASTVGLDGGHFGDRHDDAGHAGWDSNVILKGLGGPLAGPPRLAASPIKDECRSRPKTERIDPKNGQRQAHAQI